jgi:hypothetical protein
MVWEHEVYNSMDYRCPKMWLHTFEGEVCDQCPCFMLKLIIPEFCSHCYLSLQVEKNDKFMIANEGKLISLAHPLSSSGTGATESFMMPNLKDGKELSWNENICSNL